MKRFTIYTILFLLPALFFHSCNDDKIITPIPQTSFTFNVTNNYFPYGGYLLINESDGTYTKSIKVNGDGVYNLDNIGVKSHIITILQKNNEQDEIKWEIKSFRNIPNSEWNLTGKNISKTSLGKAKVISTFQNLAPALAINSIPYNSEIRTDSDSILFTSNFDVFSTSNTNENRIRLLSVAINETTSLGSYTYIESDFNLGQNNVYQFTLTDPINRHQLSTVGDININHLKILSLTNPGFNNTPEQKLLHYQKDFDVTESFPYIYFATPKSEDYFKSEFIFNEKEFSFYKSIYKSLNYPTNVLDYLGTEIKGNYNPTDNKIENIKLTISNNSDIIESGWSNSTQDIRWRYASSPIHTFHKLPELPSDILTELGITSVAELNGLGLVTGYESSVAGYQDLVKTHFTRTRKELTYNIQQYEYILMFDTENKSFFMTMPE